MSNDSVAPDTIRIIGGGPKKVLYTLKTLTRIGLLNSAKALNSKNTCKACGLGMGGQKGGMTNEQGEFPSVCNKSIQAQSTDIQPAIPLDLFNHHFDDFKQLSGHEMEHLGRLNTPLYKSATDNHYQPLSWDDAFAKMAIAFRATPAERSFFYSSGRSSNEAGFLLQLIARLYGTNNINNCSYYCHQATGVGLDNVIGTGTATVSLDDLDGTDCIFVIGANPASNHPRFMYQLKNCRERGGQVIIINPAKEPGLVRFAVPKSAKSMIAGGTWIASDYIQPNIGGDLALLKGIAKALIEQQQIATDFIAQYTENFSAYQADLAALSWQTITEHSGIIEEKIRALADLYAKANHVVFAWGMGITHHLHGVQNVEAIANLALLRGMIGKSSAGLLPLRGHSNVQGIGTIGVKPKLNDETWTNLEEQIGVTLTRVPGMDTLACLNAAENNNIDAALIMGGNLFSATPNSHWASSALNKIKFKTYLTTTLNLGHFNGTETSEVLILPVTARDEEWQSTTQESMFNYVRLSDGGIDRLTNVKPEVEILCQFALHLLPDSPIDFNKLKEHNAIRKLIAKTVKDMNQLQDIGITKQEFTIPQRLLKNPIFNTPSSKALFVFNPLPATGNNQEFPFLLSSIRSEGQFNSIIYEENDSYRGTDTRWSVLMNKEDIQELNLTIGDTVTITSAQGEMKGLKVFAFDLPRNNIMAYYPEANVLISTAHDPRSKTPAFKSVPVSVQPTGLIPS